MRSRCYDVPASCGPVHFRRTRRLFRDFKRRLGLERPARFPPVPPIDPGDPSGDREPRRPVPAAPAGAMALPPPAA